MGNIVETVSLWKAYGSIWALRNVSISINSGCLVLVLGPNGAGKSTLIKILCGLLKPTKGVVRVLGFKHGCREIKRRIGVVLHEPILYGELTVLENLVFYSSFYNSKVDDWVVRVLGIDTVFRERVDRLSYGWRKKVDLARALIHSPNLLLLDEPFSGLDESTCETISKQIIPAFIENGRTVVIASHIGEYVNHIPHVEIMLANGEVRIIRDM